MSFKKVANLVKSCMTLLLVLLAAGFISQQILFVFEARRIKEAAPVKQQCARLELAVNQYRFSHGAYPIGSNALSLAARDPDCVSLPANTNLADCWGMPLRLRIINGTALVDSAGPDRLFDTADDIESPEVELNTTISKPGW